MKMSETSCNFQFSVITGALCFVLFLSFLDSPFVSNAAVCERIYVCVCVRACVIAVLEHIKLCEPQHLICVIVLCFRRPDEACNDTTEL